MDGFLPPFLLGSPSAARQTPSSTKYSQNAGSSSLRVSHTAMDRTFGVKLNLTDESGGQGYGKPSGPPVQGLHENPRLFSQGNSTPAVFSVSPERRQLNFSGVNETRSVNKYAKSDISSPGLYKDSFVSLQQKVSSPAQIDPFYSRGEEVTCDEEYDQCWMTVFGFPPSAASYILDQFSQYGTIIQHRVFPNSNWIHILYQSKLDAKKALSKNGKVFGSGIMVGVQQCIDKSVMGSFESSFQAQDKSRLSKTSTIRPLTAAYQASTSSNQVCPRNYKELAY